LGKIGYGDHVFKTGRKEKLGTVQKSVHTGRGLRDIFQYKYRKFQKNLLTCGKILRLFYLFNIFKAVRNILFSEKGYQVFIFSSSELQI
jgi:hypothetical protein